VTYLDTHAVAALYRGDLSPFSAVALRVIDEEEDLRISPMVLLELEYLHEIKRIKVPARRIDLYQPTRGCKRMVQKSGMQGY